MTVIEELSPPPDPWEVFVRLAQLPYVLFLDSAARSPRLGRFSYLSACPYLLLRARDGRCERRVASGDELARERYRVVDEPPGADPLELLRAALAEADVEHSAGLQPFQGGAAGVLGYGLSRSIEKLPAPAHDEFELADLVVGLYDWVLAYDHEVGSCHLISHGLPRPAGNARDRQALSRRDQVLEVLRRSGRPAADDAGAPGRQPDLPLGSLAPSFPVEGTRDLSSNFSHSGYLRAVERAIEYIRAGDVFQVNLAQRLLARARWSPIELYRRLRDANPAPFAGYFDTGAEVVASSSPEQFLALRNGEVVTRPIKGTRPRGYTPEADAFSREALRVSAKDHAENVMIVDLLRNDISRVALPHSVVVPKLFELESHPTVHHLVSEVRGRLRPGLGAIDLLRAAFPGGSITGAPKVRAMEIIAELEPTARGPYCGSLGWIGFHGDMNTSILIRTMTCARGWIQFPAGGGIVAASRPENEYQETLAKAEGMARALMG